MTITDDDGGSDTDTAFITLIGLGEKVTGGGSMDGLVRPDNGGMAYLGFNAKQHPGDTVPSGETNFKYRPGGLHFHSTSYEALVVTITPDPLTGDKAQWWGSGTINGSGDYCFMVNVTDAGEPGSSDSLRMRDLAEDRGDDHVFSAAPPLYCTNNVFPDPDGETFPREWRYQDASMNIAGAQGAHDPCAAFSISAAHSPVTTHGAMVLPAITRGISLENAPAECRASRFSGPRGDHRPRKLATGNYCLAPFKFNASTTAV